MVYLHLAQGFEEIEGLTVVDVLRRADIEVRTVAIGNSLEVKGRSGITVLADLNFRDVDYDSGVMIVLPGGQPGSTHLLNDQGLKEKIMNYNKEGKYLAAICAAPMVLAAHGILKGKKATIYPGMENFLKEGIFSEGDVVEDENIITSRGPATAMKFALKLVELLSGKEKAEEIARELLL